MSACARKWRERVVMNVGAVDRTQLSELKRELTGARDEQIARVVAMVDALPDRGAADGLIAPLRGRLAQLRPARPLRFCRLLFTPFDPVIVPGSQWRPGSPSVPRTALDPIAEAVRAELGPGAAEIEAFIAGKTTADTATIARAGNGLWPAAARILVRADAPPPQWAQTGLPAAAYRELARAVAAVLTQATDLHKLTERITLGARLRPEDVLRILDTSAGRTADAHTREAWGMLLAILLTRLPQADAVLRAAIAGGLIGPNSVMRAAADQAIDIVLGGLETQGGEAGPIGGSELSEAGAEVTRILSLLEGLEDGPVTGERRRRVHQLRQRLEESCRTRFEAGLTTELVAPLMLLRPGADTTEVTGLEDTARDLCKLEAASRKLNPRSGLEAQLQRTAGEIGGMGPDGGLELADRVRLVEILAGADAALALLDRGT
jgi:hypothetical protein